MCGHGGTLERALCGIATEKGTIAASAYTRKRRAVLWPPGVVSSTCAVGLFVFAVIVECKGDGTWKETLAGQYAYIQCPGAYDGYIGRLCTETGEWGKTKDLCYLPDGRNVDEMEVEL